MLIAFGTHSECQNNIDKLKKEHSLTISTLKKIALSCLDECGPRIRQLEAEVKRLKQLTGTKDE